jgi:hypothetical protein
MSKLIVPTPTECACCHERDGCEATITLNSQYLYRIGLPKGWVAKATLHVLDDGSGYQLISFVCAACNAKGLSP